MVVLDPSSGRSVSLCVAHSPAVDCGHEVRAFALSPILLLAGEAQTAYNAGEFGSTRGVAAMNGTGRAWIIFSGVVLGVAGIMRLFDAIWAFRYQGVLPENFEGALFGHSLKTYGWVYLVVAIVLMLSAIAVMNGSQVARWVGNRGRYHRRGDLGVLVALLPRVVAGVRGSRHPGDLRVGGLRGRVEHRLMGENGGEAHAKLRRKEYEKDLLHLQVELVQLQRWIVDERAKVCIVFEGRDTAGKGGVIKRLTERVSPRVFRVVALPAPNERERSQMYMQRYIPHLPAGGEVVIFDRSWYNRAGVERVMGFCTEEESDRFLELVPFVEQAIVDSGVVLLKYWLEVSQEEQTRRLSARINDGRKTWKLSDMDLESYGRWYDYSRARDTMFTATDTETAPWYVADSNDKRRARLNVISHVLDHVPYEREEAAHVVLPPRQKKGDYQEPHVHRREVPMRF